MSDKPVEVIMSITKCFHCGSVKHSTEYHRRMSMFMKWLIADIGYGLTMFVCAVLLMYLGFKFVRWLI